MNYEYADRAIRDMNRRNLRAFDKLKQLRFDELNITRSVSKAYADSIRLAKKRYWQIATDAYIESLVLAGIDRKKAEDMAEDSITEDWILDMLEDYDPVTLYQFLPEAERKKQRLIEALIATLDKGQEVEKALRLWSRQIAHYADQSVVDGTIDGYKDADVKKVKWVTAEDEKVCRECRKLDGKVFDIDKVPPRLHYHCRCSLLPITD